MDTWQIIVGVGMVIACFALVAYLSYKEGAKGAGKALDSIAGDTPVLDRVEGTITSAFKPEQIDFFRQVIFPVFALGLSITPQGDLHEDIAKAQKLVDVVTDRKPNAPGFTTSSTTYTQMETDAGTWTFTPKQPPADPQPVA